MTEIFLQKFTRRILACGMLLTSFFLLLGGGLYLGEMGNEIVSLKTFHSQFNTGISLYSFWEDLLNLSPEGFIELGLFILVITQVIRVGIVVWFFTSIKDRFFSCISLFILLLLIGAFVIPLYWI